MTCQNSPIWTTVLSKILLNILLKREFTSYFAYIVTLLYFFKTKHHLPMSWKTNLNLNLNFPLTIRGFLLMGSSMHKVTRNTQNSCTVNRKDYRILSICLRLIINLCWPYINYSCYISLTNYHLPLEIVFKTWVVNTVQNDYISSVL